MERDVSALVHLSWHRAIGSSQLARLCFDDVSYETARKRLRRLEQAGLTASTSSGRMEGRGRPELIYFLTAAGARALDQSRGIPRETIATGPPHSYLREHYLRLVDLRLALLDAAKKKIVSNVEFNTDKEFWDELPPEFIASTQQADALLSFSYPGCAPIKVLLEIDTGNLRQTRHWEPKIRVFLETGCPIWIVAGNAPRIATLRKWTQPLLTEAGMGPGKCVFSIFDEIIKHGIFGACWYRTDGSITDLKPRQSEPSRSK